jgi:vacuole morphology and inheritance protein 14
VSDNELSVKNGAELLDRLIKDIICEYRSFNIEKFMPLLQERIFVQHPHVRQFIVSWIHLLNSVPDINFILFLPDFMDGLFRFLSDPNNDIKTSTHNLLNELLHDLKRATELQHKIDFAKIMTILMVFLTSEGKNF